MNTQKLLLRGRMTRHTSLALFGLTMAALSISSCAKKDASVASDSTHATTPATTASMGVSAQRGKYLVTIGGCGHCHTPWKMGEHGPEQDMSRELSGHPEGVKMTAAPKMDMPWISGIAATFTAFSGPWGVSHAYNLTPDSLTGIGSWSEATFMEAIRTGKHMGKGRPILPPMPWENIKQMTDDDLKSVYAYLRSIPAVHNQIPEYVPPTAASSTMGAPAAPSSAPAQKAPATSKKS